jgi:polyisoprenoid-binding protein YceI
MAVVENAKAQLLSSGAWSIDPAHSTIEFRVKHMMIQTVKGLFRDFDGAVVADHEPSVCGSIRLASLETLHADRDAHLRSADFFDAERYPEIAFQAAGSVSRVDGTGAQARIHSFALNGDRETASGPESRLYPLDTPS